MEIEYDWDYFVIGAGSGGLASAKRAAKHGKKVAIADFVKPSLQGSKWGIGGTCVNVGCIPKKLMHFASQVGELRHDQKEAGWEGIDAGAAHNWNTMLQNVNDHVKQLNWGYKVQLMQENVKYYNRLASLIDTHTIKLVDVKGNEEIITAKDILIAVGGRPTYLSFPGCKEYCVTSDDIFWRKTPPGRTLVIGAGYIAMECGGFLQGMGYDVSIMVRSVPLRNFDQDMVKRVVKNMESIGVNFLEKSNPVKIEKNEETGKLVVTYNNPDGDHVQEFDTVLLATGRTPDTDQLGCKEAGIDISKGGKIIADSYNKTSVADIYAIGDVIEGSPELTPVAIREGQLLADRLYNNSTKCVNWDNIATTIFTPLEYGCVGLTEEEAIKRFGDENVEIYHTSFKPLEWNFLKTRETNSCYIKVITNMTENYRVHGIHYVGPNAGEVVQGYAVGMLKGLTLEDLNETIGIHPTCSEEILGLTITKREQENAEKTGC